MTPLGVVVGSPDWYRPGCTAVEESGRSETTPKVCIPRLENEILALSLR